jgi:hypothetical protein
MSRGAAAPPPHSRRGAYAPGDAFSRFRLAKTLDRTTKSLRVVTQNGKTLAEAQARSRRIENVSGHRIPSLMMGATSKTSHRHHQTMISSPSG